MKSLGKTLCLMAIFLLSGVSTAIAHEIWVMAEKPAEGKPLTAILGYGEDFPEPEPIAADKLPIFNPLKVVDANGHELALKATDKNYRMVSEKAVEKGTYMVLGGYKPTFWSYVPEGSVMKPKNETPGATKCERYSRAAKGIVNIGGAADDFVTKPIGAKLEIVPLVNPAKIKAGHDLSIQVLHNGKPFVHAKVEGIIADHKHGHSHDEGDADFTGRTDENGKLTMTSVKGGLWLLMVETKEPYPDQSVCDYEAGDATLTFFITD